MQKTKKIKIDLYPNSVNKIRVNYPVKREPELEELVKLGLECSTIISNTPRIIKASIKPQFTITSKYFVNSDGSAIMQKFTDVIVDMVATAHESGLTQSINVTEGGRGGMEQITDKNKIQESAEKIALKASQLIDAKHANDEKARVVMNPDFVSLLTHEILGQPIRS